MTDAELSELVSYWQERLGLHSWDIRAKFKRRKDIHEDAIASAHIIEQVERAHIEIARIEDRDEDDDPVELDLLHELVHVRLWAIFPHEADRVHYKCAEQAVEWLARALYDERNATVELLADGVEAEE